MKALKPRIGLRTIIILGGALMMLVPGLISGMLFTHTLQAKGNELLEKLLRTRGELVAGQFASHLNQLWLDVSSLAQMVDPANTEQLRRDITLVGRLGNRFTWLGYADVNGTVRAGVDAILDGDNVAKRPWFRKGLEGPAAGDVHEAQMLAKLVGDGGGEPVRFIDFSAPVRDAGGRVTGVLGAHVNWLWVRNILDSFNTQNRDVMLDVVLVSADRRVLYGPPDLEDKQLSLASMVAAGQGISTAQIEIWPDGQRYLSVVVPTIGYKSLPSFGWSMIVRRNLGEAASEGQQLTRAFWTIHGPGAMIAIALLILGSGWVVTPLGRLSRFADRLSRGSVAEMPYEETRYDEASKIGTALVRLQSKLALVEKSRHDRRATPAPAEDDLQYAMWKGDRCNDAQLRH